MLSPYYIKTLTVSKNLATGNLGVFMYYVGGLERTMCMRESPGVIFPITSLMPVHSVLLDDTL